MYFSQPHKADAMPLPFRIEKLEANVTKEHWVEFQLLDFQSSSLLIHLRKQWRMIWVLGLLPPIQETQTKLLAPGYCLAQPQPLENTPADEDCLLCHSAFQISRYILKMASMLNETTGHV